MIVARFQKWGIVLVFREMLYMFVKYLMTSGPRCLRCLIFMPSGINIRHLNCFWYCLRWLIALV